MNLNNEPRLTSYKCLHETSRMNCHLVSLLVLVAAVTAEFNYTKCPHPWELQSDTVKQSFDLKKLEGSYYELAMHDFTQYPICPKPRCVRSHKVLDLQLKQVNDSFDLVCIGGDYKVMFQFALTNITGFFLGKVTVFPYIIFPDTVVDVKESEDGGYEWVIELQCVEKLDHVWFIGINFYSKQRNATQEYIDSMLQAARARGLGVYLDNGFGVHAIDQQNCTNV